jgi:hypothetical protein
VTHDVADDEAGPVVAQRDYVVPVAADDVARGRQAPTRDLQPGRRPGSPADVPENPEQFWALVGVARRDG